MKHVVFVVLSFVFVSSAVAQNIRKMSDAEQLGMTAGLAMACGADKKLEDFDLIAGRFLANQSPTEEIEKQQARVYAQAKWDALQQQKKGNLSDCKEILQRFNELPLFNSIVYGDGSIKLPDGNWSKPLRPLKR